MRTPEMQKKWEERWDRIAAAVKMQAPKDRVPVIMQGHIPSAKMMDPEVVPADILERPDYFLQKAFEGYEELKVIDALNALGGYSRTNGLSLMTLCKLPGVELPRTEILQIDEHAFMEFDDYKKLIADGWAKFKTDYIEAHVPLTPDDYAVGKVWMGKVTEMQAKYGYLQFSGVPHPSGWDALSAMRGMNHFFRDVRKDPQLIKDALAAMCEADWDNYLKMLKTNAETKASIACMCQPAVRANCDFVSRKTYEEFVWPYVWKFGNAIIESGNIVHFHYDAKWDDFLDLYKEFPKSTCIFDSDGLTDIYKVKELLGDTMGITGNVGASLLALGTPEEVFNFSVKQIHDMGPGYILTSSCTCPANCKPENLRAMMAAATEIH